MTYKTVDIRWQSNDRCVTSKMKVASKTPIFLHILFILPTPYKADKPQYQGVYVFNEQKLT